MKWRKPLRTVVLVAAVLAVMPIRWAAPAQAQGAAQSVARMAADAQQAQGTITTLDPGTRTLTLDDGTRLTIPRGAQLPPDVKEGDIVKATFEEQAGQKLLIVLEVEKP
jgi:Cu/Ag efflux protein CusF